MPKKPAPTKGRKGRQTGKKAAKLEPAAEPSRVDGVITAASFPMIMDRILAHADHRLLITFTATSKELAVRANRLLRRHVVITNDKDVRHPLGIQLPATLRLPKRVKRARNNPKSRGSLKAIRVLEVMREDNGQDKLDCGALFNTVFHMSNLEVIRLHRHIDWPQGVTIPRPTTLVFALDIIPTEERYYHTLVPPQMMIPLGVSTIVHQVPWRNAFDLRTVQGQVFPRAVQNFVLVFSPFNDGWYPQATQPRHLKPFLSLYVAQVRWYTPTRILGYTTPTLTLVDPPPHDELFGPRQRDSMTISFRRDAVIASLSKELQLHCDNQDIISDILANVCVLSPQEYRAKIGNETFLLHTAVSARKCV